MQKSWPSIIDEVWVTGEWPKDWTVSEMIRLPKVSGTRDCAKHRTISLISHASKIFLEILKMRVNYYVGPHIGEEQFGFVQGKGTADAILTIRNIIQKTQKKQGSQLWLMFVDYSKAFDTVAYNMLWNTFSEFGTPYHLVWMIKKLYESAEGVIRVDNGHTDSFKFEQSVR